jgi:hypothetical protein
MPPHPQGHKPAHSITESIAPVYMNSNASIICQSHHNQIYKVQHQKGSRSLASKCPQRISGLSAPERDVTPYTTNQNFFGTIPMVV